MYRLLVFLLIVFTDLDGTQGLRVLAFLPVPLKSHQYVHRQLVRGLGSKGHHVDFYTPLPMNNPPESVRQIILKDCLKDVLNEFSVESFGNVSPWENVRVNFALSTLILEKTITGNTFKELLQSNATYDVVLTDYAIFSEPLAYLAHRFQAINVMVAGMLDHPWVNEISGLPNNPSYMLGYEATTDNNLNFMKRLYNFYSTATIIFGCYLNTLTNGQVYADERIVYDGWNNRPRLMEAVSNASLILLNSHPSMAYPVPRSPHVKEIGGIHLTPREPLPKDIQDFMDSAPEGVIYFSLGSNLDAKTILEGKLLDVFVKVFKTLKQKVLWKINPEVVKLNDPKIKTQNWYPQQDVLGHKNMVLFITHGGLQSMVETINFGVPALTIPVMFDQAKDAAYMTSIGIGLQLNLDNITEVTLNFALREILTNPKYTDQAKKRQAMFRDRPLKPVDEAVYWIEYVSRHGNILQPASVHMPFYELYLLDVLAVLVITSYVSFYIAKYIIKTVAVSCWCTRHKQVMRKEKIT